MAILDTKKQLLYKVRLIVYRSDGTPVELTEFVKSWDMNLGDTKGFGSSGADGAVRQLTCSLHSDIRNNLSPEAEFGKLVSEQELYEGSNTSSFPTRADNILPRTVVIGDVLGSLVTFGAYTKFSDYSTFSEVINTTPVTFGTYAKFSDYSTFGERVPISDYDNVDVRLSEDGTEFLTSKKIEHEVYFYIMYSRLDFTAKNYINHLDSGEFEPLLRNDAKVEFYASSEELNYTIQTIVSDGSIRYTPDTATPLNRAVSVVGSRNLSAPYEEDELFPDVVYDIENNEFVFTSNVPSNYEFDIGYSYFTEEPRMIFSGYLGDSISVNIEEDDVTITARDESKILMETYMDAQNYRPLDYTDPDVDFIQFLQETFDNTLGEDFVTVTNPEGLSSDIEVSGDLWLYKTLHDMAQHIVVNEGYWAGYDQVSDVNDDFTWVVRKVPINKETIDFNLDYKSDFYVMNQDSSGIEYYNVIIVVYNDKSVGETRKVTYPSDTSQITGRIRPGVVSLAQSVGINYASHARKYAEAIWNAVSTIKAGVTMKMPLWFFSGGKRLRLFSTLSVDYPFLSTNLDKVSVNSIKFSGNHETMEFSTELGGEKNTDATARNKFSKIISRPGAYNQIISSDFSTILQMPAPINLTVVSTALSTIGLTPRATAILSWDAPPGNYPARFVVEYTVSTDTDFENAQTTVVESRSLGGASFNQTSIVLDPQVNYIWRVTCIAPDNIKGFPSEAAAIGKIGDNTAPSTPGGLAVTGLDEGLQVSFNPLENTSLGETNSDLLGYRIYVKKDADPGFKAVSSINTSTNVITTASSHGLSIGDKVAITSDGAIPSGVNEYQVYVIETVTSNTVTLLNVNFTSEGSGNIELAVADKIKSTTSTITVLSGLEPGTYHAGVTAFDTSGNESSISSIVIEKNSPAFVIRTQADMDNWENTLSYTVVTNSACPEMEYEKVVIYAKSTAYTMNFSNKNIKKPNFQIVGIGDPKIVCDTGLNVKVNNFMLTGCRFYFNNDYGYSTFLTYYQYDTNDSKLSIKDNMFENDDNGSLGGFAILDVLDNLDNCKIDIGENIFLNQDDSGASLIFGLYSSNTDTKINIYNNKFKSDVEFKAISFSGIVQNFNIRDNYIENGHIDSFVSGGVTNGSVSENTFYNNVDFSTKYYISGQHFNECSYQGNTINNQYAGASGYYFIEGGPRYSTIIGNIANGTTSGFLTKWAQDETGTGTIVANNTKN